MSITIAEIQTNLNTNLGDSSTDRISAAERLQAITESVTWLQEELQNDHSIETYSLPYFDTIHEYKVTTAVADLLSSADLRRDESHQNYSTAHKSSRELAEEIGQGASEFSFAIERRDGNSYLIVNLDSRYRAKTISDFDSTDDGGRTWAVDDTNSDATNLTVDNAEYKHGNGSLNFDVDVSQSGNNRATIINSTLNSMDLTDYEDLASFIMEVYVPDVTYFSSVSLFWGSSSTAYWSSTVTTDINGNAFVNGWNTVKFDWSSSTMTSTPDVTAITYGRIDLNYTGSQIDDTDFRIDYLRLVRPETLKFYYTSWAVGTSSAGAKIYAFTATTDIPFFSGQYDQYKYAVGHKAASILFMSPLRLQAQALGEEKLAVEQLKRVRRIIPKSSNPEVKSFKLGGINLRRRTSRRR